MADGDADVEVPDLVAGLLCFPSPRGGATCCVNTATGSVMNQPGSWVLQFDAEGFGHMECTDVGMAVHTVWPSEEMDTVLVKDSSGVLFVRTLAGRFAHEA